MRIFLLLACIFGAFTLPTSAQLEANNWYWGKGMGVQFLPTLKQLDSTHRNSEECVSYSDRNSGQFLFGSSVNLSNKHDALDKIKYEVDLYNSKHERFNSQILRSDASCSQGLLVVPHPVNCNQYYILSLDSRSRTVVSGDYKYKTQLSYSLIDMSDGIGQVIVQDMPILQGYFTEGMTGTIHSNGRDFWVIIGGYDTLSFVSIPITDQGINGGFAVYSYPERYPTDAEYYCSYKLSPNGKKFLDYRGDVCISDFDNSTGIVSDRKNLGFSSPAFTFSPNSSKAYFMRDLHIKLGQGYVSQLRIFQMDLSDSILPSIPIDSAYENQGSLSSQYSSMSMQIAPDAKVYYHSAPNGTDGNPTISYLGCIEEPNKKGSSCRLVVQKLEMRNNSGSYDTWNQFPNYMDYIFNTDGVLGAEQLAGRCSPPLVKILPDSGCIGSTLVFTDLSKYATRRLWTFESGSPSTSTDSIVPVTYSKSGTYRVILTVENNNGTASDTTYAVVYSNPNAKAGADKNICPTSSTQLGDKPEPGNKYSWQPTTNLDDATLANPTASPTTNMQYILTVTSEYGCVATDTVLVTIGTIVAKVSPDTAICSGSSVQLIASGGAEYVWSPSVGLSNSSIENPIATPAITTQYKVIVSSGTCKDSAFVTVTVNPQPLADAGPDQTICSGEPVNIGVPAVAGNTYSWQPPTGLSNATISNPTASPTITTEYILTVTSNGCVAFDTVVVTVGNLTAKISGDVSICAGKTAQLLASGGTKYVWSPSDGLNDSSIPNPTASPSITTRYKVVVSSGSCIDSAFVTVTIAPPSIADAGKDRVICVGESTEIGTAAINGNSYIWSPSIGLLSPSASQTTASPTTTTTYTLKVTNPAGCVSYDTITITVNPLNERSFTLQPDTVIITPGQQFRVNLNVPSGVSDWGVRLGYNPLLVKYNSIANNLQAIADNQKGELVIRGTNGNTTSSIVFDAFLPHTSDTIYPVRLSVDTSKVAECETWSAAGNILMLADYCGKNIRVVSATGKSYFLTAKGNTIDFGVGLSGNVRLEVFDYLGHSMQILNDGNLEAGAYSAEIDLPTGVYFCRMRAGHFESVGKVLIAR